MQITFDEFLAQLAAVPGDWSLDNGWIRQTRGAGFDRETYCPLQAVLAERAGRYHGLKAPSAVLYVYFGPSFARRVMQAADREPADTLMWGEAVEADRVADRAALLKATRLA